MYVRNGNTPTPYQKTITTTGVTSTITIPCYTNRNALPPSWPTISGGYTGAAGTALPGGARDASQNIAATLMSIGNPSYPALRALQECCQLWASWGRQTIEDYDVALAQ